MSERKTAEIKFRVAPSEKARWQAEAERKQLGLSELIRERMNEDRLAADAPRPLLADDGDLGREGDSPVAPIGCGGACGDCSCPKEGSGLRDFISTNVTEVAPPLTEERLLQSWGVVASPQTDAHVGTSGEVGAVEEKPQYPWMFRG